MPRPLRKAATVILLRDGAAGPEVLLLRRIERGDDRSSGAWVFPGGTLDAQDGALRHLCAGLDDGAASRRMGLAEGGLDFHVAAIRECYEESGLLLATGTDGAPVAAGAQLRALRAEGADLAAACARLQARLAADRLVCCAHWITPLGLPKRFDTRFFVAEAPPGQDVVVAESEIAGHAWVPPGQALADSQRYRLVPATRRVLQAVAGFASVRDCLAHFSSLATIPTVLPRRALGAAGGRIVLPWEPPYAEVALLDPQGRGDAWCELRPGEPTLLLEGLWRVPQPAGHAYLLRLPDGGCVVIDGQPGFAPLQAALDARRGDGRLWAATTACDPSAGERTAAFAVQAGATLLPPGPALLPQLEAMAGSGPVRGWVHGPVLFSGQADADARQALLQRALACGLAPCWVAAAQGFLQPAGPQRPGAEGSGPFDMDM